MSKQHDNQWCKITGNISVKIHVPSKNDRGQ